jgi:hypothetical protein
MESLKRGDVDIHAAIIATSLILECRISVFKVVLRMKGTALMVSSLNCRQGDDFLL